MEYKLNLGCWGSIFAVPASVVDDYIKVSSGDNLKILLYFLRNSDKAVSLEQIANALALTENQVEDGLAFWKQRGLLAENNGELMPSEGNVHKQTAVISQAKPEQSSLQKIEINKTPQFTPKEIAATVRGNSQADLLFKYCEKMFGRPLKRNEQNTLMIILEDVCMSAEVAMVMIEYCFSAEKISPAYMRTLAVNWAELGINTIEKAEARVIELKSLRSTEAKFRKLFGMTSAFSKAQSEMLATWVDKYCFSDEMIDAAYQITLDNTGKLSFPYMNKLLANWHDKGYTKPEQVQKAKEESKSDKSSSFDVSQIEKLAAEKYKE